MGSNPMQKMKRNSTLIGLVIGLVIGLILCVVVYLFLTSSAGTAALGGETVTVCMLNKTIKSGQTITEADIVRKNVSSENVPLDAVTVNTQVVAKIDLTAGTILSSTMLTEAGDATVTNDLRQQEYNMVTLPSVLRSGDYIDIRLQLPNGGDYVVVSKKKVLNCNSTTIWLNMYEEEIELMSNAIVEYYIMAGSKLYATIYTQPGMQTAAIGTYVPNSTVANLINQNPNITNLVNSERYSDALKAIRNDSINSAVNQYSEEAITNIEKNMQEEIESLKESREMYFSSLNSANN